MLNSKSIDEIAKANFGPHFCRPLYESYSFARIPQTICHLLGEKEEGLPPDTIKEGPYDIVILFLIDGFGWRFFEENSSHPFLKRFMEEGIVSKLTSQFPSTTAAHVTCINTGLEVGQSGVYEWFYFEPIVDAVIAPLLFSYAGDTESNTLKGVAPESLFPRTTIYQKLKRQGIPSFALQHEHTFQTPYSRVIFDGAEVIPYKGLERGLVKLREKLESASRGYFYFYFGDIDSVAHRRGVSSSQVKKTVDISLAALESFFQTLPKKKIALLLTADHGMIDIDPKTTVYLNQEIPEITSLLQKNKAGKPIVPAGSCRDFFVHARKESLIEVEGLLREKLKPIAEVHRVSDLIEKGFFGRLPPSPQFLSRVGNLAILPFGHNSVWWYEKHRFEQRFHAMHGGLSRAEMETVLAFLS